MELYLGLDLSTQGLSAALIDAANGRRLEVPSVSFGRDLPEYGCPHGFRPGSRPGEVVADPLLWVAALERLFTRMAEQRVPLGSVRGVAGAAQQHGSVALRASFDTVGSWDPARTLVEQVAPLLSRGEAPIWLDASTTLECEELEAALGGPSEVARITGSRAIERFTGPQLRAFHRRDPGAYRATREFHLVSSFAASLLLERTAPLDHADALGMNLVDLTTGDYAPRVLEATAPGLRERLPRLARSDERIGVMGGWFVRRFGFDAKTPVLPFTGDNCSSLVGTGAVRGDVAVLSLGTSDTCFRAAAAPRLDPDGFGHVFGNPLGGFLLLSCFANGSLAREEIARRAGVDWDGFARALQDSRPGQAGRTLLPYLVPEMTPRVSRSGMVLGGPDAFREGKEPQALVRALVEAQACSFAAWTRWMGPRPARWLATGGASRNRGLLQVFADVLGVPIVRQPVAGSAALGGALRAAHHLGGHALDGLLDEFAAVESDAVEPDTARHQEYAEVAARYAELLLRETGHRAAP